MDGQASSGRARDSIAAALDGDDVLQPAHAALDDADPERACEIALDALADAEDRQDPHRQAKALLFLAHLDRLASRFRAAHGRAKQAARLFRSIGDSTGESGALSTLAHASTCLGRNEEAVESALISVRLAGPDATASHKALLFNYLGVAYLWGRDFAKADQALTAAVEWAEASGGRVGAFQPLINEVLVEALGAVATRSRTGALPKLDPMAARHARCEAMVTRGASSGLFVGGEDAGFAAWWLTSALMKTWTGAPEEAEALLARASIHLGSDSVPTLGHAYEHWVRAELAWSRGRLAEAAAECAVLVAMAQRLEYEQMACLGHLLLSQIHEQLGEPTQALAALRSLREREERIRAESLESRERAVSGTSSCAWPSATSSSSRACRVSSSGSRSRTRSPDWPTAAAWSSGFARCSRRCRRAERRCRSPTSTSTDSSPSTIAIPTTPATSS